MPTFTGLTTAEATARRAAGQGNTPPAPSTKTVAQIVRDNIFTYFNLVFLVLAGLLALVRSWANMAFLGVVFWNALIGIVQQLRAKHTIDKLTLVTARRVDCLRDGAWSPQLSADLVLGDVVGFAAGDQIVADAVVLDGTAQANEALITGEAAPVAKAAGDELRSGSFLMSGRCTARLTAVGADSYASKLTAAAQAGGHRVAKGEMMRSLDRLIRFIGLALVPLGLALLLKQHLVLGMALRPSIEGTVGALVGMIPEGLYLLTSVALAVGMVRLARGRVLAQDMNCIETLARVDVLCVDKTGTITEPVMRAADLLPLPGADRAEIEKILTAFYADTTPDNDTARALKERFGRAAPPWPVSDELPFNTAYKYSGRAFGAAGAYLVGAPDILAGARSPELADALGALLDAGQRVLLLARCRGELPQAAAAEGKPPAPEELEFLALLPLENRIRATAPQTFAYFAGQGVAVKVISGDDPRAVSRVAATAGIPNAEQAVDAATLKTEEQLKAAAARCTVFGRVTPEQKRSLVHALQAAGHTVAMTGDGVNDVLALKDADCGIAMASGAEAAAQVAQLVLLDSDFAALPAVVGEGRRVINNIQRSASLFLVKNIFSFLLGVTTLFLAFGYPFQPLQLTLVSAVTIGIPSFILALEPNRELVRGRFITNVLRAAAPGGLADFVLILAVQGFGRLLGLADPLVDTVATLVLLGVGLAVLWGVCRPFTTLHKILWAAMLAGGLVSLLVMAPTLGLAPLTLPAALLLLVLLAVLPLLLRFAAKAVDALAPRAAKLAEALAAGREQL